MRLAWSSSARPWSSSLSSASLEKPELFCEPVVPTNCWMLPSGSIRPDQPSWNVS
jgi:hypothetical protein